MRARRLAVLLTLVAVGLAPAGCLKRSKVARTYVLDPMPAVAAAATSPTPVAAKSATTPATPVTAIGVERVRVPDWLDRPQVTGRAATGEVVTDEFSRWGEPLPRGLQRVIAENLVALLPDRRVVAAPFPPSDPVDLRLEITMIEAARQPDGAVLLEARWAVVAKDGRELVRRRSTQHANPTTPGAAGAVAGLNQGLAELSREIAGVLQSLPPPEPK